MTSDELITVSQSSDLVPGDCGDREILTSHYTDNIIINLQTQVYTHSTHFRGVWRGEIILWDVIFLCLHEINSEPKKHETSQGKNIFSSKELRAGNNPFGPEFFVMSVISTNCV